MLNSRAIMQVNGRASGGIMRSVWVTWRRFSKRAFNCSNCSNDTARFISWILQISKMRAWNWHKSAVNMSDFNLSRFVNACPRALARSPVSIDLLYSPVPAAFWYNLVEILILRTDQGQSEPLKDHSCSLENFEFLCICVAPREIWSGTCIKGEWPTRSHDRW